MAWNEAAQAKYRRIDDHRQNNLTDEEWLLIEPMIPKQGRMGRPLKTDPARSLMRSSTCRRRGASGVFYLYVFRRFRRFN